MVTKKFDFRRQIKSLSINELIELKEININYMMSFIGYNEKEASKYNRYISYIDNQIKKLTNKN